MLNAERQALDSEYADSKMDGADAAILAAMIKTTSSDLRDCSHYPAASRMVPVSPATQRSVADQLDAKDADVAALRQDKARIDFLESSSTRVVRLDPKRWERGPHIADAPHLH